MKEKEIEKFFQDLLDDGLLAQWRANKNVFSDFKLIKQSNLRISFYNSISYRTIPDKQPYKLYFVSAGPIGEMRIISFEKFLCLLEDSETKKRFLFNLDLFC